MNNLDWYGIFLLLLFVGFAFWHSRTHVEYKPRGKRVWMVTDGKGHWVEGRKRKSIGSVYGLYGERPVTTDMTYEEIMEEIEKEKKEVE